MTQILPPSTGAAGRRRNPCCRYGSEGCGGSRIEWSWQYGAGNTGCGKYALSHPGCLVTDLCSTKAAVTKQQRRPAGARSLVGGHPMAGSEKTGVLLLKPIF